MHIKDFVQNNFVFDQKEVDSRMSVALERVLKDTSCRGQNVYLIPDDRIALQTAHDWLEARGWDVAIGTALSGLQAVVIRLSGSIDRQVRRERDAAPTPAPVPVVDRRPPWERSLPLPSNVPACVVEARKRWYFDCGIYAPLEVLLEAYPSEGSGAFGQASYSLYMAEALEDWGDCSEAEGFQIAKQPNRLTGADAFLACVLPGRNDNYDILVEDSDRFISPVCLRAAFRAIGSYIREVYPEVGDTKNARKDGLDYRVLASLADHGVDPTDDNTKNRELAAQWAECQKDPLVLGAFYALQRIGEFINNLFPEKAGEEAQ